MKLRSTIENCSICGSANALIKHSQSVKLRFCRDCEVHANADTMSGSAADNYYKNLYFMGEFDDAANIERIRYFRHPERIWLMNLIHETKPAPADLLDIGCDKGFFLDDARRYGYNVSGIEPSERARA